MSLNLRRRRSLHPRTSRQGQKFHFSDVNSAQNPPPCQFATITPEHLATELLTRFAETPSPSSEIRPTTPQPPDHVLRPSPPTIPHSEWPPPSLPTSQSDTV